MLTHFSTTKTVALAAVALSTTFLPGKVFSQQAEINGGWVTRNGNVFELSASRLDTIVVVNPVTEEEEIKIRQIDPQPMKMNGHSITNKPDKWPYFTAPDKDLRAYLIRNLERELAQLQDGRYTFNLGYVVTDEKGKIVYFDFNGVQDAEMKSADNTPVKHITIDKQVEDNIRKKVDALMTKAPSYIPASLNGQSVPSHTIESASREWFTVKDHKISVE